MIEFDGKPGKIPDDTMQAFLEAIAEADVFPVKQSLKVGDEVRIRNGPLAAHKGQIESVKGARANVLLALFGGTSLAVVPVDSLELADTTQKDQRDTKNSLQCGANQTTRFRRDHGRQLASRGTSRVSE
jgi:hypothetical protein